MERDQPEKPPDATLGGSVSVVDNTARHRFEADVEGQRAELVYRLDGDRLVLVHTEVPDELAGRGIGGQLVEAAVEAAVVSDLRIVPQCPFVLSWLRKHPDLAGRVRIDWPTD